MAVCDLEIKIIQYVSSVFEFVDDFQIVKIRRLYNCIYIYFSKLTCQHNYTVPLYLICFICVDDMIS